MMYSTSYVVVLIGEVLSLLIEGTAGAVRPPPWADPQVNPCAAQPRGWQYIHWPADQQCYKIFQTGYPCPETMELVPAVNSRKPRELKAECRCAPASAMHRADGRCYELFTKGPCQKGQYFAPHTHEAQKFESKARSGLCKILETCPKANELFWPQDEKCYRRYSQGPCPKGQLLNLNNDELPSCMCSNEMDDMRFYFWEPNNACYEHFTRGPCQEKGHLFLPQQICDCHSQLPHYHQESRQCYELGSAGPCNRGHEFILEPNATRASCRCKPQHVMWTEDNKCYRPYTQGPCASGHILTTDASCIPLPCTRGYLYFPEQRTCYRVGSPGPCSTGQVVTFDLRTRPSIDGISYNGVCRCSGPVTTGTKCLKEKRSTKTCDSGLVAYTNRCYKLYTQGPCDEGQWLIPNHRQAKELREVQSVQTEKNAAKCECKPGFTPAASADNSLVRCLSRSVTLANYLNKYFIKEVR